MSVTPLQKAWGSTGENSAATVSTATGGADSSPFASSCTAGNLIFYVVLYDAAGAGGSQATVAISDTKGNAYTKIGSLYDPTGPYYTEFGYAKNIAGGATDLTATFSGAASIYYKGIAALEISGLDTVTPFVSGESAVQSQAVGASATVTSGDTGTLGVANGFAVGFCSEIQNLNGAVSAAGSGFSLFGSAFWDFGYGGSTFAAFATQQLSSNAALAATFTADSSGFDGHALVAVLRPAGGGATGSGAATEGADTASGSGATSTSGAASVSEVHDSVTATGSASSGGNASILEGRDSAAGAGATSVSGSAGITEGHDAVAGSGSAGATGSAAITQAADVVAGVGSGSTSGSASIAEASDTALGVGQASTSAVGSLAEAHDAISASGSGSIVIGTAAIAEGADLASGSGATSTVGSGAVVEAADIVSGETAPPPASVIVQIVMSCPTASADGFYHCRYPTGNAPAGAPTGLSAVPASLVTSLYWTPAVGATSYNVKRSTTNGSGYATVGTSTTGFYSDTGLTNGTTYYYVVTSVTGGTESSPSGQVSSVPVAAPMSGGVIVQPGPYLGISPTTGPAGTVINITAIQANGSDTANGSGYFVGCCTAYSGISNPATGGLVTDAELTILSDTTAQMIIPADGITGQIFIGNGTDITGKQGYTPIDFTMVYTQLPAIPSGVNTVVGASGASVTIGWNYANYATGYSVQRATVSGGPYTQIGTSTSNTYTDSTVTSGTEYFYVVEGTNTVGNSGNSSEVNATPQAPVGGAALVTVTPGTTQAISPLIYGVNADAITGTGETLPTGNITFNRLGGNRWTAYNWQTNYSNSGSDNGGAFTNDQYLSTSATPLDAVTSRIATDRTNGYPTVMTVPMCGYVSADDTGAVTVNGTSVETSRFKVLAAAKGSAFTTTPSNSNAAVYVDEMVWATDQFFSGDGIFTNAPTTYPVCIELDNEPDIWNATHEEIETSTLISYSAFATKTIAYATAIKNQFPQSKIFGPVNATFAGMYWWDNATFNGSAVTADGFNWWIDSYLASLKTASTSYGANLLDVFSYHWYSQAVDPSTGIGVTAASGSSLPDSTTTALVNSSRSLYDPQYVEDSYITSDVAQLNGAGVPNAIQMLPRVNGKLTNSGLSIPQAITEYFNGGNNHIAGLVAQADNLGAFGAYGVYAANIWPIDAAPYPMAAFSCFRNFDGAGSDFGNVSVAAAATNTVAVTITSGSANIAVSNISNGSIVGTKVTFSATVGTGSGQLASGTAYWVIAQTASAIQVSATFGGAAITPNASGTPNVTCTANPNVSAYVSTDTAHAGRVVMVLINRSFAAQVTTVSGQTLTGTAHLWQITGASASGQSPIIPVSGGTQSVSGSSITLTLPALSVTTVDIH